MNDEKQSMETGAGPEAQGAEVLEAEVVQPIAGAEAGSAGVERSEAEAVGTLTTGQRPVGPLVPDAGAKKWGDAYFIPIRIGKDYGIKRFTRKEIAVLTEFLATGSRKATAEAVGITPQTVTRVLKRASVKALMAARVEEAAVVHRFDASSVKARLLRVAMGEEDVSREQMEALKECRKMFSELNESSFMAPGTEIVVAMRRRAE